MPDLAPFTHAPVLIAEVLELFAPLAGRRVLDCTLGLGGHSERMLEAGATVLGTDRDPHARALAATRLAAHGQRFSCRAGTFADAAQELAASGALFDGVLADLGVSSMQLDDGQRGFSIRSEARAGMRMGDDASQPDAIDLIAHSSENDLVDVLRRYGEEPRARPVARALQRCVGEGRISGVALADAVRRAVPGHFGRHPAMRAFQALRIAVNDELGQLERLLSVLPTLLKPAGCAVIISFHSLEDRMVKHTFREQKQRGAWAAVAKKPIEASADECAANPRASSAKLRWARAAPLPEFSEIRP